MLPMRACRIVFHVWVTFAEQEWVNSGERRGVTASTPALASFRRLSKAAINAAGVSRCAIERKRVVLSAVANSDNRRSSVDMVLDL